MQLAFTATSWISRPRSFKSFTSTCNTWVSSKPAFSTVRFNGAYHKKKWKMNTSADDDEANNNANSKNKEPSEPHDIPQSAVDWNSEWARFQNSGMRSMAPQGREPVSKQEKARRKVEDRFKRAAASVPTRQQLFADWRFWAALILALSLFSAFVNSTTSTDGFAGSI